jgi:toxin CcdB
MKQFDIYRLQQSKGDRLVVILQHETTENLETRIVAPLARRSAIPPAERLRPAIEIRSREYVLVVDRIAAAERRSLGQRVGSVAGYRDDIISALDYSSPATEDRYG